MKNSMKSLMLGLIGSLSLGPFAAKADLEVSAGVEIHAQADFYAPLTPYGAWIEVGSYGRCWHPAQVAVGWRPYCYGHWVWTDCGWYWVSDEPWAWACYHYGSWVDEPGYGWVWVPGVEWAPAWVSWRVGGGYVGWAPLPPAGVFVAVAPDPALFVFVGVGHFTDPVRPSTVIVNNTTIINQTTIISGTKRETLSIGGAQKRVVVNQGPGIDPIQKATGRTIRAVPIREAASQTPAPRNLKQSTPAPAVNENHRGFQGQPTEPAGRQRPAATEQPRKSAPQHERPPAKAAPSPDKSQTPAGSEKHRESQGQSAEPSSRQRPPAAEEPRKSAPQRERSPATVAPSPEKGQAPTGSEKHRESQGQSAEPSSRQRPPAAEEPRKSAPQRERPPATVAPSPEKGQAPAREHFDSTPPRPPTPRPGPEQPLGPPPGNEKAKGEDKGHGHDKDKS